MAESEDEYFEDEVLDCTLPGSKDGPSWQDITKQLDDVIKRAEQMSPLVKEHGTLRSTTGELQFLTLGLMKMVSDKVEDNDHSRSTVSPPTTPSRLHFSPVQKAIDGTRFF